MGSYLGLLALGAALDEARGLGDAVAIISSSEGMLDRLFRELGPPPRRPARRERRRRRPQVGAVSAGAIREG